MISASWLILLIPACLMTGWILRSRIQHRINLKRLNRYNTTYFRGLNYLLNEQPDKAIEVFLKIARLESGAVETHLALGNLFRRRGEVDRAIRLHQDLIEREQLSSEHRTLALLELGEDYMRAGLLDRAELLYGELVMLGKHTPAALRHLISITQQENDWHKAIDYAEKLEEVSGQSFKPTIAQYHCEIAEQHLAEDRISEASHRLNKALSIDPDCVRASIVMGRQALKDSQFDEAIQFFRRVEQQDLDHIPDILDMMLRSYTLAGREQEAREFLENIIVACQGISPVIALADIIDKCDGRQQAVAFMGDHLRKRPSVRGLDYLIGLNLGHSDGPARENLLILKDLTTQLLSDKPVYRCSNCGFGTKAINWLCPGCKQWNTVKPIYGVAGE